MISFQPDGGEILERGYCPEFVPDPDGNGNRGLGNQSRNRDINVELGLTAIENLCLGITFRVQAHEG